MRQYVFYGQGVVGPFPLILGRRVILGRRGSRWRRGWDAESYSTRRIRRLTSRRTLGDQQRQFPAFGSGTGQLRPERRAILRLYHSVFPVLTQHTVLLSNPALAVPWMPHPCGGLFLDVRPRTARARAVLTAGAHLRRITMAPTSR